MSGDAAPISRRDIQACALLLVAWTFAAWLVGPSGEFSLNDDFAYALSVRWLLEDGVFQRTAWTYVPSLSNVLWGAAFAGNASGFFEALRISTLTAGAIGVVGVYALARQAGGAPLASALAAATLGFNPIYFSLAATFMTDVHFTMWVVWSLFFLGRALREASFSGLVLGTLCAVAAILTRQSALALGVAFAGASVIAAPRSPRSWLQGAAVALACGAAYAWFQWRYTDHPDVFAPKVIAWHFQAQSPTYQVARNSLSAALYGGALTLPLAPMFAARARWWWMAAAAVVSATLLAAIPWFWSELPPGMNILRNLGIGPIDFAGSASLPRAPQLAWWIGCALGGFSIALAAIAIATQWRAALAQRGIAAFWLGFGALHLGMYLVRAPFFDRYLLAVLPAWVALSLLCASRRPPAAAAARAVGFAFVTGMAFFSVAATHDFLARHRAAWDLANREIAAGAPPESLDAGFSYRGWHEMKDGRQKIARPEAWLSGASRVVSVGAPIGDPTEIVYRRWLPPGDEAVRFIPAQAR